MPIFEKPHIDHEKHLCRILERGITLDEYKMFVKNGKYVCRQCGRVAFLSENLCDPIPLYG